MFLGNIKFDQVEQMLGYKLNEQDKIIFEKYHSDDTELADNKFHIYHLPISIHFKGEEAKQALLTMFTVDKLVNRVGAFAVYETTKGE